MLHDSTPRVAVLGAGGWGRNHVRTFHELGALALVCDPDAARTDEVRSSYPGVDTAPTPDAALQRDDIDGIVVATPAVTHADLAVAAVEAGKDVLVEKPLAIDVESAERVVAAAEAAGAVLLVGHVLEYHPAVRRLHELVGSGEVGDLRWAYSHRLNLGRVRTVENTLWSFAPHDVALLIGLAGTDPETVTCRGGAYLTPGIEDVAFMGMSFPGGVEAQIFASWLHPFKEQRLVVVGSEAMAIFDDTAAPERKLTVQPYTVASTGGVPSTAKGEPRFETVDDTLPLTAECRDFLDRIADRGTPITDGRAGLAVLRVLDAAGRSMAEHGAPVPYSPTARRV